MRTLVITSFITLDGVVESPNQWSGDFQSRDTELHNRDVLFAADTLLLGRISYEGFASAWPNITDEDGFAERMNAIGKIVVSNTLQQADWTNSTIAAGDAADIARELKQQPGGDILVWGSPTLASSLIDAGLVDRYELLLCPVVAGTGTRLFPDGASPRTLRRTAATPLSGGMIALSLTAAVPAA